MQRLYHILESKHLSDLLSILVIIGLFLEIIGGIYDSLYHISNEPDFFWSTSHVVIYFGVTMIAISMILGSFALITKNKLTNKIGLLLIILGSICQLISGYGDYLSHTIFGIDGLISPSHQVLESGLLISSFGVFILLTKSNILIFNILLLFSILSIIFSFLWLAFNFSLLIIDILICLPIYHILASGCAIL